jgi:hypothetical protein
MAFRSDRPPFQPRLRSPARIVRVQASSRSCQTPSDPVQRIRRNRKGRSSRSLRRDLPSRSRSRNPVVPRHIHLPRQVGPLRLAAAGALERVRAAASIHLTQGAAPWPTPPAPRRVQRCGSAPGGRRVVRPPQHGASPRHRCRQSNEIAPCSPSCSACPVPWPESAIAAATVDNDNTSTKDVSNVILFIWISLRLSVH